MEGFAARLSISNFDITIVLGATNVKCFCPRQNRVKYLYTTGGNVMHHDLRRYVGMCICQTKLDINLGNFSDKYIFFGSRHSWCRYDFENSPRSRKVESTVKTETAMRSCPIIRPQESRMKTHPYTSRLACVMVGVLRLCLTCILMKPRPMIYE